MEEVTNKTVQQSTNAIYPKTDLASLLMCDELIVEERPRNEEVAEPDHVDRTTQSRKRKAKKEDTCSWEHFNLVCDKELADKVRAIAERERLSIRQVAEQMFRHCIDIYEQKHGVLKKTCKKSAENLFG